MAEGDSFAVADMSEAYAGQKVTRGMKILRASGSILLQDEIECEKTDVIRWSAHTPAAVRLYESGKAAVLDMDGTKMYVALLADGCFEVRAAAADERSPYVYNPNAPSVGNAENKGVQKLVVSLSGKSAYRIAFWMIPLAGECAHLTEKPVIKPLAIW